MDNDIGRVANDIKPHVPRPPAHVPRPSRAPHVPPRGSRGFSRLEPTWDPIVPVPGTCSRDDWLGVFRDVDEELLTGGSVHNANLYVHAGTPLGMVS